MRLRATLSASALLSALVLAGAGCESDPSSSGSNNSGQDAAGDTTGGGTEDGSVAGDTAGPGGGDTAKPGDDATTPGDDGASTTDVPVGPKPDRVVDLRVDTNRNGVIDLDDPTEDEGEDEWTADHGAIFLANIDDDLVACPKSGKGINDITLPDCNDAADEVVNGEDDLLDMAPLHVVAIPDAPDGAKGHLDLGPFGTDRARLFIERDGEWVYFNPRQEDLTGAELRAGVNLKLEGRDVVRDTEAWDGMLPIELTVDYGDGTKDSDKVQMRVAPMVLYHHLLEGEISHVTTFNYAASKVFRDDLKKANAAMAKPVTFDEISVGDQWTQDFFEPAYMSMPSPSGQHAIRVYLRSANVFSPSNASNPLRPAGKVVFTHFRGKDAAGVQQFDIKHNGQSDSLNSFGNTETIPPYSKDGVDYPLGRVFQGEIPSFAMDKNFVKMMDSQAVQPRVTVDTSWLLVGHVDETITFVRADNERGWTIGRNDAMMAVHMLEELEAAGHGAVPMFVGKDWDENDPAEATIAEVLDDTDVMSETAASAAEVDDQVEILKEVTGVTDDEMLLVPYLHWSIYGYSVAYQPGTINGQYLDHKTFAPPETHGPLIDGKDPFKEQFEKEFAKVGVNVYWIENWDLYHALLGEVHCGTNTTREIPSVKWWETGR